MALNAPVFRSDDDEPFDARGVPRWVGISGGIALVGILVIIIAIVVSRPPHQKHATFVDAPEARPETVLADGYIGSTKCQSCHAREYSTWHDSYHRTMTQVASPATIRGQFDVELQDQEGRFYRLGHDNEHSWVEFDTSLMGAPQTSSFTRKQVMLCTGSHHMQAYWLSTGHGNELALLPFVWLIGEEKWVPRETAFLKPVTHFTGFERGRWNSTCIDCHTTHGIPNHDPPEPTRSTVSEFGITCEACHGPGEAHARWRSNATQPDFPDPIVHPARLTHERSAQVCGQCHMAWHGEVADASSKYRPGEDLMKLRAVRQKPSQFWADGMIRVAGREFNGLLASPCFQRGEMSCLSCHLMHPSTDDQRPRAEWQDDQLQPQMRGNEACFGCHREYREESVLVAHTHHSASSEGSRCYNCHMPNTTYGLLKATRSHHLSSPAVASTLRAGRPPACNLCHLDKPLSWTDEKLVGWYGQSPSRLPQEADPLALAVEHALVGDAGQRALVAWHLGWAPAKEAAGDNWLAPYLAVLLVDNYPAVRAIAHRSLQQLPGYDDIRCDPQMSPEERQRVFQAVTERWEEQRAVVNRPELLINQDGKLDRRKLAELLDRRDQTEIVLDE